MALKNLEEDLVLDDPAMVSNLQSALEDVACGRICVDPLEKIPYPFISPLGSMIEWLPQTKVESILDSFVSDREDDREFLIHHAVGLDCESIAHTHLIIDPVDRIKVLGYFTLGSSHMSVFGPRDHMNGRTRIHTDGRTIPIHAIWRICPGEGCPVTSSEMLAYALDVIRSSNMLTGCRFVRSDCRHSDSALFQDAGFRFIRTDEKGEMDQLLLVM